MTTLPSATPVQTVPSAAAATASVNTAQGPITIQLPTQPQPVQVSEFPHNFVCFEATFSNKKGRQERDVRDREAAAAADGGGGDGRGRRGGLSRTHHRNNAAGQAHDGGVSFLKL